MLKSFMEIVRQLLGYAKDTEKNTADIKALQAKLETTTSDVRQIASDVSADRRVAAEQRENLILRLQLALKDG